MQRNSGFILSLGITTGSIGLLYFLSLIVHLPFLITCLLCCSAALLSFRWVKRNVSDTEQIPTTPLLILGSLIVATGLIALKLSRKYGDWDAIYIWNFHALFLKSPLNWTKLFSYSQEGHSDYPMLLPANVAFFWRLFGGNEMQWVPFLFSFLFTLLTPVLIFLELYQKHLQLATLCFLLFLTNTYYLNIGLIQCADTPLSFFFLCAFVTMNHFIDSKKTFYLTACGIVLGCCSWTKNEGAMLALLFVFFYLPQIFSSKNTARAFLSGISLPLLVLIIFKTFYAPANDLIRDQHANIITNLTDKNRYKLISSFIFEKLNDRFYSLKIGLIAYTFLCIFLKKFPSKGMVLIMACMAGYFVVYLLTPYDLFWHLNSSIDRLMLQLMPALIYVLANEFSTVRIQSIQQ